MESNVRHAAMCSTCGVGRCKAMEPNIGHAAMPTDLTDTAVSERGQLPLSIILFF